MLEKIIRDFMTIWTTIVLALNYLLLLLSDVILRIIGRQGAAILTRVMGIILTALSVEFVLAGLSIGSWATPHR
jgi:multiple antibiotic resistance protein